jgi:hypothetical protein
MPNREPPVEYAALGRRTEARAVIDRLARQRLEYLLDRALVFGLDHAELAELSYLKFLNGTGPPAPVVPIKDGGCTDCGTQRSMTIEQRMLQLYEMRWPPTRLTGRQAQLELLKIRGEWHLSRRQRQLQRLRDSWAWQP